MAWRPAGHHRRTHGHTFTSLGVPPSPIQAAVLPDALAGADILGRGRTGGKGSGRRSQPGNRPRRSRHARPLPRPTEALTHAGRRITLRAYRPAGPVPAVPAVRGPL